MTNTPLRPKSSESGFALILAVSVVGLAFVVTVGTFLVAASLSQNTGRVASAKVDVALREDLVMRQILQQAAQGVCPNAAGAPGNWTTIMTNAVTNARAVTYVDPAELSLLGVPSGAIPANLADTGAAPLNLFQGYNQEVPFGGTSGLANLLPAYNALVQPPLMNWSSASILSSATALTTPQEFFLGSLFTATSSAVSTLSLTKRWGLLVHYPNIRFGYKRPGSPFVARRVWWRIPLVYRTTQTTVQAQAGINPYPAMPVNYVLSVYEIPTELPISGNANLMIGQNADGTAWGDTTAATGPVQITGSIYGDQVQLNGGTYNGGISSRQQVNVAASATVAAETFSDNTYGNLGVREQKDLSRSTSNTTIGAAPLSAVGDGGKVLLVPVMAGNNFFVAAPNNAPTHWDLYARPYYKCRVRIIISSAPGSSAPLDQTLIYNPNAASGSQVNGAAGKISVTINYLPDTANTPDAVLGIADTASGWQTLTYTQTSQAAGWSPSQSFMTYTSTGVPPPVAGNPNQNCNILQINILQLIARLSVPASQLYSIYLGYQPLQPPANNNPLDLGIAITGSNDLSTFTNGLSIVTKHRLYLIGDFNQVPLAGSSYPNTSLYSPDLRYGISGVAPQLKVTGRVSIGLLDPTDTGVKNPLSFNSGANASVSSATNTFVLSEATTPSMIPPITRLNLLFTIEKERTN